MKRIIILIPVAIMFFFAAFLHAEEYKIDPDHSQAIFRVRHFGTGWITGRFSGVTGKFAFTPGKIGDSDVSCNIDVKSIDTDVEKRDNHLKSPDFFHAEKYPEMTFATKKIDNVNGNRFQIIGDLTIHGVTREIVFNAAYKGRLEDPWGFDRVAFTATSVLDRKDSDTISGPKTRMT